jgi:integrase
VRHVHAVLHRSLKDVVRWGRLARNPVDLADPPRAAARGHELRTWSAEQLAAFLSSQHDDRRYALWHTLAMTGLRRGEALGLRWQDVDLEAARLCVRRALVPCGKEVLVSEPKTARGRRVVALDPETVAVLRGQAARQLAEQAATGSWGDTGLVFTTEDGQALHPWVTSRCFRAAVKEAMLPDIRLHDLRHTHATLALRAGIHPKVVSERLGHATVSVTLDTYSHAIPAMQEEAAALIAGLVFAGK